MDLKTQESEQKAAAEVAKSSVAAPEARSGPKAEGAPSRKNIAQKSVPQKSVPQKNVAQKKNRKKVRLEGADYYVVTLEEIDQYRERKDGYKDSSMRAFIIYMHSEFLNDLKKIRKTNMLKNASIFLAGGVCCVLLVAGGGFLLSKAA